MYITLEVHPTVQAGMLISVIVYYMYCSDIAEYMGDGVTHIVTESKWDDNFDEVCVCCMYLICCLLGVSLSM